MENKTDCNIILNGFIDKTAVILSTKRLNCLNYENTESDLKEFDLSNFSLKKFQIIDIKGFKKFLRSKDLKVFEDTLFNSEIENNSLCFKKEISTSNREVIMIYKITFYELPKNHYTLNKIVGLNLDYLKPIFREFKIIDSLRIFLNNDYPAFFELDINQGFLIAPTITQNE